MMKASEQDHFREIVKSVVKGEKMELKATDTRTVAIVNFIKDLKEDNKTRTDVIDALMADFKTFGIASRTTAYIYYTEFLNIYDQQSLFEQKELLMAIAAENILEDRALEKAKKMPDGDTLAKHNKNLNDLLKLYPKTPPVDYTKIHLPDMYFSFDPKSLSTPIEQDEKKFQKKVQKYFDLEKKHFANLMKHLATDTDYEEIAQ